METTNTQMQNVTIEMSRNNGIRNNRMNSNGNNGRMKHQQHGIIIIIEYQNTAIPESNVKHAFLVSELLYSHTVSLVSFMFLMTACFCLRCTYEISHETMSFIAQKACIYRGLRGH
jgi:hypothetical protein